MRLCGSVDAARKKVGAIRKKLAAEKKIAEMRHNGKVA